MGTLSAPALLLRTLPRSGHQDSKQEAEPAENYKDARKNTRNSPGLGFQAKKTFGDTGNDDRRYSAGSGYRDNKSEAGKIDKFRETRKNSRYSDESGYYPDNKTVKDEFKDSRKNSRSSIGSGYQNNIKDAGNKENLNDTGNFNSPTEVDFPVARKSSLQDNGYKNSLERPEKERKTDSKTHFASLEMFTKHAEPSMNEFLSRAVQAELERKQREEEDALYRSFIKERKENENILMEIEEEERNSILHQLNLTERSKIINLSERHCTQMMDLIHREKIKYLTNNCEMEDAMDKYPRNAPQIEPTKFSKDEVYENNMSVFEEVDATAIKIASADPDNYTELVRDLTQPFFSDIDKARAIFRYMTEREFEQLSWFLYYPKAENKRGAPTNLFRSVEFGIESKAYLFKRLCSYAGLHSLVIKGYCKGKDYIPGEKFVDNRYRCAWNAVFVAGEWRIVQVNWATMQVNLKATRETKKMYQDHYFLADADKFIFEFFPIKAEMQFLLHPITMDEFENLPLLRSTFFQHGLRLSRSEGLINAVVRTDEAGKTKLYFKSESNLSYHYTLTNRKTGGSSVKIGRTKFPLNRFAMMYMIDHEAIFDMFLPAPGEFILDIGVSKYPSVKESVNKPLHYINTCKFLIKCDKVTEKTPPLPDCVPGEWGPRKAYEIFGLQATSHKLPFINASPPSTIDLHEEVKPLTLNIEFEKKEPVLDYYTILYQNGTDGKDLSKGARYRNKENYVIFDVKIPREGQYGLDIYARRSFDDKMLHCCKYLISYEN